MDKISVTSGCYVVAVSGGVDSVVLLDVLSRQPSLELIVAHFDHGIREDSAQDAIFVADLAKKYGLPFETKREELGPNASEDRARARRYEFLHSVANKYKAKLITAHHSDDVIETIIINLLRGTGWRGLAVLDSDIVRPLININKSETLSYAKSNGLKWHEDATNISDNYLRNRIRHKLVDIDEDTKRKILELWSRQKSLKRLINEEVKVLIGNNTYSRYFFINIDYKTGMECLRYITDTRLTRPQLLRTMLAIKTALPQKKYQAGNSVEINFTARNFTVKLIK
jgi:tRNA(Ile)-lysidine synthetase-like protein